MILTVDVGNTQIKLGGWREGELTFVSRMQTNSLKTEDEYAVDMLSILRLNNFSPDSFEGAIIASVVPALTPVIKDAVAESLRLQQVLVVSPGLKTGLNIKLDNPASLGSDLVCASVAVISKYTLPCTVISLGTATAVLAIDSNGGYLGGMVCAGVNISLEALSRRTAQLPHISLNNAPPPVIGTNSVDAIRSGIIYGTADMVTGAVRRMQAIIGNGAVIACGGYAEHIIPHCGVPVTLDQNLVLEGLKLIYAKNVR